MLFGVVSKYTIIFPLLFNLTLPFPLESLLELLIPNSPYNIVGPWVLFSLVCIFIISLDFFFKVYVKQKNAERRGWMVINFLIFQLFILFPIAFYIDLSNNWSRAGDGQFFFAFFELKIWPVWFFLGFGILSDILGWNLNRKRNMLKNTNSSN